jgi:hypothetical protein
MPIIDAAALSGLRFPATGGPSANQVAAAQVAPYLNSALVPEY